MIQKYHLQILIFSNCNYRVALDLIEEGGLLDLHRYISRNLGFH